MKTMSSAILLIALATPGEVFADGPAMQVNWKDMNLTQQECIALASQTFRAEGLTGGFEVIGETVFGEKEGLTAAIRCIELKKIAVFIVAGPDYDKSLAMQGAIIRPFVVSERDRKDDPDRFRAIFSPMGISQNEGRGKTPGWAPCDKPPGMLSRNTWILEAIEENP